MGYLLALGLLALLVALPAVATMPPSLPSSFYGAVTIGAENLPESATVTATVNGVSCGQSAMIVEQGQTWYSLDCLADEPDTEAIEGGRAGDVVAFVVRNGDRVRTVTQTAMWQCGKSARLDLQAIPTAVRLVTFSATTWPAWALLP